MERLKPGNIEELYEILSYLSSGPLIISGLNTTLVKVFIKNNENQRLKDFMDLRIIQCPLSVLEMEKIGIREIEARHRTSESWKPRNSHTPRSSLMSCISVTVFFSHLQGPRKGQSVGA